MLASWNVEVAADTVAAAAAAADDDDDDDDDGVIGAETRSDAPVSTGLMKELYG